MTLPFTTADFLAVFAAYNAAIWPAQIVAYGIGAVALAAVFVRRGNSVRLAFAALAILWAFTGIGYHLFFFAKINPIAPLFAAFFVLQAVLFMACAIRTGDLRFKLGADVPTVAGLIAIAYTLAVYPILGFWAGHGWDAGPMFGVAPCPTTMFTIGFLLMTRGRWRMWLSIIPFLWSIVGLAAAVQLGIPEDVAMPLAGLVLAWLLGVETLKRRTLIPPFGTKHLP